MRRRQLNTTLPEKDLEFIKENLGVMTKSEMAKRLKCSDGKIRENCRIAGIDFPPKNRHGFTNKKAKVVEGEFFNVNQYSDWVTGGSRYMGE